MKFFKLFLLVVSFICLIAGCSKGKKQLLKEDGNSLRKTRKDLYYGLTSEQKKDRAFYISLTCYESDLTSVKKWLKKGRNPNYCLGECGWLESNPLLLLSKFHYDTFYREVYGESIPEVTPDIALFNLLIDNGADITLYPYVYAIVYRKSDNRKRTEREEILFIDGSNRILRAFLENGADVNAKANHKAFDWQTYDEELSYEEFNKMCMTEEATTPLYEAIKKGMKWESQVDLLLEYGAVLDESCLEAAELSGDKEMIKKIDFLWKNK